MTINPTIHHFFHPLKVQYLPAKAMHGFNLIELMVTIAIMAITLSIAIPSMSNLVLTSKLSGYANHLVASAYLARSEAIKRNLIVTLCTSTNGTSCAGSGGWEQGWIILTGTEIVRYQQATATGIKITESNGISSLTFQATGVGSTQATLTVCRNTPTVGDQERVVTISATGRPSVAKTTTGICN